MCGEAICSKEGYNAVKRVWKKGDIVELCFDMSTEIIRPIPYGTQILMNRVVWGANSITTPSFDREDPEAKHHLALRRGPIMLARDEELEADITAPIVPKIINGFAAVELVKALPKTQLTAELILEDGKKITLCDYASCLRLTVPTAKPVADFHRQVITRAEHTKIRGYVFESIHILFVFCKN